MSNIDTLKKHLLMAQSGALFEDPREKANQLFSTASTYESSTQKQTYIENLYITLRSNASILARIQNQETSKPTVEIMDEIVQTIDFLKCLSIEDSPKEISNILVISHFTSPIMTSIVAIAYSIVTSSKVLIRPSTKASKTLSKLYSILPKNDHWDMVFCEQEAVDAYLIKDQRFSKIYIDTYENIFKKIEEKSSGLQVVGHIYSDEVLVIDSNSDLEKVIAAYINQFFLFNIRYGIRLNKILVEESEFTRVDELLRGQLTEQLNLKFDQELEESFSRNTPKYKLEKIKAYLLDAIAEGAEISFGSITDKIDSPTLLTKVKTTMNIFSLSYWEPIIQLIPIRKNDFPSVVRSLDPNTIYVGTTHSIEWMKEKYKDAKTSTILGINTTPLEIWDTLLKRP